jgi:TRAP-type C4-dicarboxylate transport system substrate-binding protein
MMKARWALGTLAALTLAALPLAVPAAEPVTLKFGFPPPASSYDNTHGVGSWIEEVEKASGGTLKIQLFTGPTLGTFRDIYDRTLTGASQISFSTFGDLAGQFQRTQVASLPFLTRNTADLSMALWKLYADGLLPEYGKVRLLALFSFPNAVLHTNKPIATTADLKGMRIAASSRITSEVVNAFGAAPVSLTPSELYEAVSHRLAAGAITSLGAAKVFKLTEVTTYHLEAPLGAAPGFVFMNKDVYATLPQPAKDAIDKFSGASFSKMLGEANELEQRDARDELKAQPGQHVGEPSAAEYARWQASVQPIVDEWVKNTPDGAKVLAAVRAELDKLASAH